MLLFREEGRSVLDSHLAREGKNWKKEEGEKCFLDQEEKSLSSRRRGGLGEDKKIVRKKGEKGGGTPVFMSGGEKGKKKRELASEREKRPVACRGNEKRGRGRKGTVLDVGGGEGGERAR